MNPTIIAVVVANLLYVTAWIWREREFSKERGLLLDRLMAKSLPEFKYEARKEAVLKDKRAPKPFPSDDEMAEWELKHRSQVHENNNAVEQAIADLKRKAVEKVGGAHGS